MRVVLLFFLLVISAIAEARWWSEKHAIMGTSIDIEIWHEDATIGRGAIDAVVNEMYRIDALLSPFKGGSIVTALNRRAASNAVQVDAETYFIISKAEQISELSAGAFDISFASVGFLYDFPAGKKPSVDQIKQALPAIDYRYIRLKKEEKTVEFLNPLVKVDLGGIAKGYACDRAIDILKTFGVKHGVVSAGGDSKLLGDRRGRPWMIGIKNPRGERPLISIPIQDVAVSTSGDYERYFKHNGVRYHHIINPSNGESARELRSVTIIAEDGIMSDGLSTAVFVLGTKKGLELINGLEGVSAILIDSNARLHYSYDLEGL